jgi:hypothetical protein
MVGSLKTLHVRNYYSSDYQILSVTDSLVYGAFILVLHSCIVAYRCP